MDLRIRLVDGAISPLLLSVRRAKGAAFRFRLTYR
jgi:hypothetical protein